MAFSPRAAQLMHELNQTISNTQDRITNIATELEKGIAADKELIRKEAALIGITMREYFRFTNRVQQGPDAPVDPGVVPNYPNNIPWHTLEHKARQTTAILNQWPSLQVWINQNLDFEPAALDQLLPAGTEIIFQQQKALDRVFDILQAFINPNKQDAIAEDLGCFADIPLPQSKFIKQVQAACRVILVQNIDRPARFIDVGCGGGLKVLTAAQYFTPCDGLDFDPGYVAAAQDFMGKTNQHTSTIYEADALTFDKYDQYDVIYFFRPLKDEAKLIQLEKRIAIQARPNSLLIAPYSSFADRAKNLGCAHIAGDLYLAQGTQAEADALRTAAETIGPFVPDASVTFDPMWQPIENRLRNAGFT